MKNLGERNIVLLIQGLKMTGNMTDGFDYSAEEMYVDEIDELSKFCGWVDREIGGCSKYNIEMLFKAFKGDEDALLEAEELKVKIKRFHKNLNHDNIQK